MTKAKIIIIGGTIAAGKSSLMEDLSQKHNWYGIPEIDENDKMQSIILQKLYEGTRIHKATIEFYFILNRIEQYQKNFNRKKISILDRSIMEDWIFSALWLKDQPRVLEHYQTLWKKSVKMIFEKFGKPLVYFFLEINWTTFKKRIFERNRTSEIRNFSKNEVFFRELLDFYNRDFVKLLKEYEINVHKIKTDSLTRKKTLSEIEKILKSDNII